MTEFKYIVTEKDKGLSIKELLRHNFTFSSRLMSKLKREHLIFLNGQSTAGWITPDIGDEISVRLPEEKSDFPPEDIAITVVYEDSDIMVINKQPGVVVHPTKGKPCHTIANGLMKKMLDEGQSYKIRFINRLDMNTSGLLAIAKNSHAQDSLTKQMQQNKIHKKYKAIVCGEMPFDSGTIDFPIGRPDENEVERWVLSVENGGYPSVTHYNVLERLPGHTLVELSLETGRTHQIRVHLSYIGYPILGDHLYCHGDPFLYRKTHGDSREEIVSDLIDRQALHAYYLSFIHPVTGERISLEAPLPEDMENALKKINS